jgi:putative oxidoreductase
MFNSLIRTDSRDYSLFIIRVILGFVMLPHGMQKLFGWFGGMGVEGTVAGFSAGMGIPSVITYTVILSETLGSLLLIMGFAGRLWSLLSIAVMIGAVVTVHSKVGFFMNWAGNQSGEGFEYHILALALGLAVLIKGSGAFSIDAAIQRHNHAVTSNKPASVRVA